ncbi:MAG: hypothetical protein JW807_16770 [Spirochaetes bacterium]|nr:hypothetical protein [Spirochaetota bacterium]
MKLRYIIFSTGIIILLYEIAYVILYFLGYNVYFLTWVDRWGPVAGWILRALLFMIAGLMVFWGSKKKRAGEAQP